MRDSSRQQQCSSGSSRSKGRICVSRSDRRGSSNSAISRSSCSSNCCRSGSSVRKNVGRSSSTSNSNSSAGSCRSARSSVEVIIITEVQVKRWQRKRKPPPPPHSSLLLPPSSLPLPLASPALLKQKTKVMLP